MEKDKKYHAIILGKSFGAQLVALFLAKKRGLKVKLLEQKNHMESFSSFYDTEGRFLMDRDWEPILGFFSSSSEEIFLRSLGIYEDFSSTFLPPSPALQLISPQRRIDCSYPLHRMNWEEEYLKKKNHIEQLWGAYYASSHSSKQCFSKFVQKHKLDEEWISWGVLQLFLYGNWGGKSIPMAWMKNYTKEVEKGLYFLKGGKDFLKKRILDELAKYKVIPEKVDRPISILYEKGSVCGVELAEKKYFSNWIVGGESAKDFTSHIPKRYQLPPLLEEKERRTPKAWRFYFAIHVPKEVIPEGMGNHFCFHLPSASHGEKEFFQVLRSSFLSYKGHPPEKEVLLIRLIFPFSQESLHPLFLSSSMKRVLRRLKNILPFLTEENISIHLMPKRKKECASSFSTLEQIPNELLLYEWEIGKERAWEWDWEKYGLPGLALCSKDSTLDGGFLGELQNSIKISEKISHFYSSS